jgi:membrane protease YdiL (CAAX protease family)
MIRSLEINWSWQEGDMNTCLPIIFSFIFFIVYWFIARSEKIKNAFYKRFEFDQASVNYITFNRIVGFIAMGVIPGALCLILMPAYSLADYGLTYDPETILFTIAWTVGLSLLVIPLAYFSAQKPKNLVNYPQIRARIWTRKTVLINVLGWALYLFGYEFLFRGILLFPLAEHLGIWTAIAINIALYSATHIPKGLDETIGAIPLGLVFCLLTLASGTIWIAFFVHLIMALTNSFTALKFHPDIHYTKSEK